MPKVTVYHPDCGAPIQVEANDLDYQDPPVTRDCPRCGANVQVSN